MDAADLAYQPLLERLEPLKAHGRTESATFLRWFLENIFRLDDVTATDAVCDGPGDLGIDGIYVDGDAEEVLVFQAKLRQRDDRTIGDNPIREFAGSIRQLETPEAVSAVLVQTASDELRKLIHRTGLVDLLSDGFSIRGVFVTNASVENAARARAVALNIEIYDRDRIADEFIELDARSGIDDWASFDVSDAPPLFFAAGRTARVFLIAARASDLLRLNGLSDGVLFSQNVRLSLGNTKVNKDIAKTLGKQEEHIFFPLYHNGITLICREARQDEQSISVNGYVVVNGAQSLTVLYHNRYKVSDELRMIVKIVEVKEDAQLSNNITLFSNNQNSIKPRDMRSNHQLQIRLKNEFEQIDFQSYRYEVKRGETIEGTVLTNEEAGRLLLAFDLREPWSCHQIYKVFDEKHADIFGRQGVTAWRIILLDKMMSVIRETLVNLESEPFEQYTLTRFFILYCIGRVTDDDEWFASLMKKPETLLRNAEDMEAFLDALQDLSTRLVIDLKFEAREQQDFDYKVALKSPVQVEKIASVLERAYERDVARGREAPIGRVMMARAGSAT